MKFTKKELGAFRRICDAVGKVKDSLASELYSKMKSAYPNAVKQKLYSKNGYQEISFIFAEPVNKQILSILQGMGFTVKSEGLRFYEATRGKQTVGVDIGDKYIELGIYE